MRTRLKVCCISSVEEAAIAVRAGADALGLVAEMPSGPGPIGDALIREIAKAAPPGVATFLLTSRTEPEAVVEHVLSTGVNTVQLVDDVPEETYAALRRSAPSVRIVQVLHVQDRGVVREAERVSAWVDAILLDSGRPGAPVKELGGTGRVHDWELSAEVVRRVGRSGRPVYLAGGIRPENVGEAMMRVRPFGIDLCSGVRTSGRLDAGKVGALVMAMRGADAAQGGVQGR